MRILLLAFNDGSDVRLTRTLSAFNARGYYLHIILLSRDKCIIDPKEKMEWESVDFHHKNPLGLLLFNFKIAKSRFNNSYDCVYVVDEQCFLTTLLSLIGSKVVLDVYDSIWLKLNLVHKKLDWIKSIFYKWFSIIVVTDETRLNLLPKKSISKAIIVPNSYPLKDYPNIRNLGYFDSYRYALVGTIAYARGAKIAFDILGFDPKAQILAAGWLVDDYSKELCKHPRFEYRGTVNFKETHALIGDCNYIICVYPENNINNKYASPNKYYDSIICRVPLIINKFPVISSTVNEAQIGVVINDGCELSLAEYNLILKDSIKFRENLGKLKREEYCLEEYMNQLLYRLEEELG